MSEFGSALPNAPRSLRKIIQEKVFESKRSFLISSYILTNLTSMPSLILGSSSSQLLRQSSGRKTFATSARLAAKTFSLIPPTAKTFWFKDISPVIATFPIGVFVANERRAETIVTPALGPS